jgi:hypothetical protein
MTPGAAVGGAAVGVGGTGEGGGSSSACCADFCGLAGADELEQAASANTTIAMGGRGDKNLLRDAATLGASIGNGKSPHGQERLAIENRLDAYSLCYR